jgi:hypothetical protein
LQFSKSALDYALCLLKLLILLLQVPILLQVFFFHLLLHFLLFSGPALGEFLALALGLLEQIPQPHNFFREALVVLV